MTDVIFCCYSTISGKTLNSIKEGRPSSFRPSTPNIKFVDVPYKQKPGEVFSSPAFNRSAIDLKTKGGILKSLIRLSGVSNPRTVGFLTFSGGTQFLKALFANSDDARYVDSIIALDGIHFNKNWEGKPYPIEVAPWLDFAKRAVDGEKLFVNAHTHIASPAKGLTSTNESAAFLNAAMRIHAGDLTVPSVLPPESVAKGMLQGPPPPRVAIKDPITGGVKAWNNMPLKSTMIGGYYDFDFGGITAADHIFVATFGQKAILESIAAPRLSLKDDLLCTRGPQMDKDFAQEANMFSTESCRKVLTTVPDSYKPTSVLPLVGGFAGGAALGYYLLSKYIR